MMKSEFERLIGKEISQENYKVVETVYAHHSLISDVEGKKQVESLYNQFGLGIFHDMLPHAEAQMELDRSIRMFKNMLDEETRHETLQENTVRFHEELRKEVSLEKRPEITRKLATAEEGLLKAQKERARLETLLNECVNLKKALTSRTAGAYDVKKHAIALRQAEVDLGTIRKECAF